MNIRNLEKKDAPEVALLIPQLTKNIIEPEKLIERISDLAGGQNCQYFVAELNDKIIGFGGLAWYRIPSKGLIGWVEELVVDTASRGQGIGHALMEKIIAAAKEKHITQLKLTTTPEAKKLYESLGFTKKDQDYLMKSL